MRDTFMNDMPPSPYDPGPQFSPSPHDLGSNVALVLWRLNQMEGEIRGLHSKFDGIATNYVNTATLMLTLEPLKTDIKELQEKEKNKETERIQYNAQFRLALLGILLTPIGSILATVVVAYLLKA